MTSFDECYVGTRLGERDVLEYQRRHQESLRVRARCYDGSLRHWLIGRERVVSKIKALGRRLRPRLRARKLLMSFSATTTAVSSALVALAVLVVPAALTLPVLRVR